MCIRDRHQVTYLLTQPPFAPAVTTFFLLHLKVVIRLLLQTDPGWAMSNIRKLDGREPILMHNRGSPSCLSLHFCGTPAEAVAVIRTCDNRFISFASQGLTDRPTHPAVFLRHHTSARYRCICMYYGAAVTHVTEYMSACRLCIVWT